MSDIYEKSLEELEYKQLLNIISKFAYSETTKQEILETKPFQNEDLLKLEINFVSEMCDLISNEDSISLDGFEDYSNILNKSKIINAVLNTDEILDILDLISSFRL